MHRVGALESGYVAETEVEGGEGGDDGWLATHDNTLGAGEDIGEICADLSGNLVLGEIGADGGLGSCGSSESKDAREDIGGVDEIVLDGVDGDGPSVICGSIVINENHMNRMDVGPGGAIGTSSATEGAGADGDDEYADLATFEEDNMLDGGGDEATLGDEGMGGILGATHGGGTAKAEGSSVLRSVEPDDDNVVRMRRYDLSMTYDKYYQTPRVWLFG